MAGFNKRANSPRREKMRLELRRFDLIFGILALIVVAAVWCSRGSFQLKGPDAAGFAGWFLLFVSYVPLLLAGAFNAVCGITFDPSAWDRAWLLGTADLSMLAVLWLALRLLGSRKFGTGFLRAAGNFALMVLVWGVFQLGCTFMARTWRQGGRSSLPQSMHQLGAPSREKGVSAPPARR